ncbi:MAG: DUF465 domain-containing protein [Gammaproteobacteria bacterium]|nr:DUF465 domain-containing protein [Gammaproteobacteria bacterium]MYD81666.1 DUF465 domain-containing protein [Gammaproteobacteria bacterium]
MLEQTETEQQLERLRVEHRDLDEIVDILIKSGHQDEMRIQRLKKKKLRLRDQIARLESSQSLQADA